MTATPRSATTLARPVAHARRPARERNERGFTLIELVIVLAIMVVAAGFTILNLDSLTTSGKMRAAARDVANHIKYARSYSILSGKPIYLYYDFEQNAYYMSRVFYGGRDGPGHEQLREDEYAFELPRIVRMASVTSALKTADSQIERFDFTGEGVCLSHSIYLQGTTDENAWWTVEVNGLTGRVSIHDRRKEFDGVRETLPGL